MDVPPMSPNCPWYPLTKLGLPNVKWCEATQCSWITEPANTWSNLGYIVVALLLLWSARQGQQKTAKLFGWTALFVGASSFIYHASYTFFFQIFDFIAMFVFVGLLVTLNVRRLGWISESQQATFYFGQLLLFTVVMFIFYALEIAYQSLVLLQILLVGFTEWRVARARQSQRMPGARYGNFFIALATIGVAAGFSLADVTRTFCDPDNHFIQGHAIWHYLGAISIYFCYRFYRQFENEQAIETGLA